MRIEVNTDGKQEIYENAGAFFSVVETDSGRSVKIGGMTSLRNGIHSIATLFAALLEVFEIEANKAADYISFEMLRSDIESIRRMRGKKRSK